MCFWTLQGSITLKAQEDYTKNSSNRNNRSNISAEFSDIFEYAKSVDKSRQYIQL